MNNTLERMHPSKGKVRYGRARDQETGNGKQEIVTETETFF